MDNTGQEYPKNYYELSDTEKIIYDNVTDGLQEILGKTELIEKIKSHDKNPITGYWGTSSTGKPHIGYFVPLLKIAELADNGCNMVVLIADLHAVLDNLKSDFKQVELRSQYYEKLIKAILKRLDVNFDRIQFSRGTSFQLSKEYTIDMYKAHTILTLHDAQHAGSEVVKQTTNPLMSGLMYPTLQLLDEEYLKFKDADGVDRSIDFELEGIDQRKIAVLSRTLLPKLGYKRRVHLMNKMLPALSKIKTENIDSVKMSSSSSNNDNIKIEFLDTEKDIKKKINSVYCLVGDTKDNTLLVLVKTVIFPILKRLKLNFDIRREEKYGGNLRYRNYDDLHKDFEEEKLHAGDLKSGVFDSLNFILEPIRKEFDSEEMKMLIKKAYP